MAFSSMKGWRRKRWFSNKEWGNEQQSPAAKISPFDALKLGIMLGSKARLRQRIWSERQSHTVPYRGSGRINSNALCRSLVRVWGTRAGRGFVTLLREVPRHGDWTAESEAAFDAYVDALIGVIGHADLVEPLKDYCLGLLMPMGCVSEIRGHPFR
ncbi:hypothetical protein NKJ67_34265 [Mesorhizobium sp. M0088]